MSYRDGHISVIVLVFQALTKPVYGTPRSTKKDHSYAANLFKTCGVQTESEELFVFPSKEVAAEPEEAKCDEPSSELSELAEVQSSDYWPSTDTDTNGGEDPRSISPCEVKKFVVFGDSLDQLHRFCNRCGSPVVDSTKFTTGSMVSYQITCHQGHNYVWQSQPVTETSQLGTS